MCGSGNINNTQKMIAGMNKLPEKQQRGVAGLYALQNKNKELKQKGIEKFFEPSVKKLKQMKKTGLSQSNPTQKKSMLGG